MMLTIAQLRAKRAQYKSLYPVIAIRTQDEPYVAGVVAHKSNKWINGRETDAKLSGLSATNLRTRSAKAIKMHSSEHDTRSGYYYGKYQAIIGGTCYRYGEDAGEVIILDPVVIEILS